ncbi:MAG TPA: organomercurial lyase [Bryobacteraceae bacterium]|nr:organomercurial lyase [Bryobacteraceae bacterium]
MMPADFDSTLRVQLYREFVSTGRAPSVARLAEIVSKPVEEIRTALERLAAAKVIALQPESREILFAAPLSAVPTPYLVRAGGLSYFAPCVWDALGVVAMLRQDAAVETSCPCCGEAMTMEIRDGRPESTEGVIHFGIPAKRWWDNIFFT